LYLSCVVYLGFGPLGHAEEIEFSHMWYCHPDLYNADRAKDYVPEVNDYTAWTPRYQRDTLCYVPSTARDMAKSVEVANGTTGSPTKASREKGRLYHEHNTSAASHTSVLSITSALNWSPSIMTPRRPPHASVKLLAMESPRPDPSVLLERSPRVKRCRISSAVKSIS
jgi:hypothetical protein